MPHFLFFLITFIFVFTNPALARDCTEAVVDTQSFWQALAEHVIEILVTILTPIIIVLINKAIKIFEQKTKIDVAERHEALIEMCVSSGIAFAHEQGRKALKSGAVPVKGDEKKIMALETASNKLKTLGVVEQDAEVLAQFIDARLNQERRDPKEKGRVE